MRLFFSINPLDGFKDKIQELQNRFRNQVDGAFVDPQKFHVTILFLGEVEAGKVIEIKKIADRVAGKFSSFSLMVRGIDLLGESLVVTFESSEVFSKISADLKEALAGLAPVNLAPAQIPHVTLWRFRKGEDNKPSKNFPTATGRGLVFSVSSFSLVESTPTPKGHIYYNLCEFRLSKISNTT